MKTEINNRLSRLECMGFSEGEIKELIKFYEKHIRYSDTSLMEFATAIAAMRYIDTKRFTEMVDG